MAVYFQSELTNMRTSEPVIFTDKVTCMDVKDSLSNGSFQTLKLTIGNICPNSLSAKSLKGEPGEDNYHFKLSFSRGVLSDNTIRNGQIRVLPPDNKQNNALTPIWKISKAVFEKFGAVSFYFLNTGANDLKSNEKITFQLENFTAAYSSRNASDRLTGIMLLARNYSADDGKININEISTLNINEISTLDARIKNFLFNSQLPVALMFRDYNTVLNEESASNSLSLELVAKEKIRFSLTSRLFIAFDAEPNAAPPWKKDWALSTVDLLKNCKITPGEAKWKNPTDGAPTANPDGAGQTVWTFQPNAEFDLNPGDALTFDITQLQTGLPAGPTNLYLRYQDVPGFGNGNSTLPILKTPLVTREEKVGIGTNLPTEMLTIGSTTTPGSLALAGDRSFLQLGVGIEDNPDTPDIGKIGYNTHALGLNIYGGGARAVDRKITLYNEGGAKFIGPVQITDDYTKPVNAGYKIQVDGDVLLTQKLYINDEIILSNAGTAPQKIGIASASNDTAGKSLEISAGSAQPSGPNARAGGDLTLRAGNAYYTGGSGNQGSVKIISGGNGVLGSHPATGGDIVFLTGGQENSTVERMRIANNGDISLQGLLKGTAHNITSGKNDLSIFCGESSGGWRAVMVAGNVENGQIEVTIDTSACGFTETPIYLTSIRGDRYMDWMLGANTIFTQSKNSFTVRLTVATYYYGGSWKDLLNNYGNVLNDAKNYNWIISWVAIGR